MMERIPTEQYILTKKNELKNLLALKGIHKEPTIEEMEKVFNWLLGTDLGYLTEKTFILDYLELFVLIETYN